MTASGNGTPSALPLRIAYLTSLYPKISHSFVRQEISAVESRGIEVLRFAIRRHDEPLVDERDLAELQRTRVILAAGAPRILLEVARCLVTEPRRWFRTLATTLRIGWRSERGIARHLAYFAEACVLRRWTRSAQHLHAHFSTNATMVALLCRTLGGPRYSFTMHGPELTSAPLTNGLLAKVHGASFVACVSWFGRSQLMLLTAPQEWSKLHLVRCGADERFFGAAEPVSDVRRLVCIARFSREKGHLVLLDALGELRRQGVEFEMVLVGDGDLRPRIEERIRANELQGRVRLAGWLSGAAVRDEILRARAVVLASFEEGLPVVLMEALALGRPAVATYIGGIPELVESGRNGWLAPAGSVGALAAALRAALECPIEEVRAMGKRGAAAVRERHDALVEGGKLAEIFVREVEGAAGAGRTR